MEKVNVKKIKVGDIINTTTIGPVVATKVTRKYIYLRLLYVPTGVLERRFDKDNDKLEWRGAKAGKFKACDAKLLDFYTDTYATKTKG